ncbi:CvpA family protein [Evansella tamaricis]|uniref:CvpA family protein n=1 Tax=Evansella tamaricis TaxID=2069301 RepID=A0ABS6JKU3_9BACI|nr:CvpA family protein [Evansella tamaricis]MBU9714299.1 CvpA family protein [Evansella tamaricis]
MLSFLLFFTLVISFFVGFRRGLILQLIHLAGFVAAFYVAYTYYHEVAHYIRLWIPFPQLSTDSGIELLVEAFGFEKVYYNGIAFAILFFGTKIIMQVVGSLFDFLAHLPFFNLINRWLGGILGFIEMLLITVILLHLGALIQISIIQEVIQSSSFATMIFEYTPIISDRIKELWLDTN